MMKTLRTALMLTLTVALLSGCSIFPSRTPDLLTVHDFGPLPDARTKPITHRPVVLRIKSPSWLSGTSIHYRLLFKDQTALHVYAQNRWIAPPAALLKARIRAHLGIGLPLSAHPPQHIDRLVVTLSRFDQDFKGPNRAFVRLAVIGRLYSVTSGRLLAVKNIKLERPCSPNIAGAVSGLSALARQASTELVRFTQDHAQSLKG